MSKIIKEMCLIVAVYDGENPLFKGAIGYQGKDLIRIKADMDRFREKTTGNPIIMGRKTAQGIPPKFFPLKDRDNIVLNRNGDYQHPGVTTAATLPAAIAFAQSLPKGKQIFNIGGAEVYKQAIDSGTIERVFLTKIMSDPSQEIHLEHVTFLENYAKINPSDPACEFKILAQTGTQEENGIQFIFFELVKK